MRSFVERAFFYAKKVIKMDIKQLQYFVVSVDMGSFRAAAQTLITTQPNVSKVIKSLEAEVHTKLLERRHNGIVITPEGERVYKYALEVLKNVEMITDYTQRKSAQRLSLSSMPSNMLAYWVADFYRNQDQQGLEIDFWQGTAEEIVRRVHRRYSELGFIYVSQRNLAAFTGFAKTKGIEFTQQSTSDLYLYTGEHSPYSQREYIEEKDLDSIKVIQHSGEDYPLRNHLGHLREEMDASKNTLSTNSDYFIIQMLKNTDYASVGSSFQRGKYQEYGINSVLIKSSKEKMVFGYISRHKYSLSQPAQDFIDYIKANCQD